jgi:type IV secretory pathway TrbF-like protein
LAALILRTSEEKVTADRRIDPKRCKEFQRQFSQWMNQALERFTIAKQGCGQDLYAKGDSEFSPYSRQVDDASKEI